MSDFATIAWAVGLAAWLVLTLYVVWIVRQIWKDRPMRCPETGSIILVGVERVSPGEGHAPEPTVRRCRLWPDKMNCARGCLVRYEESMDGFPLKLDALRPFGK